MTTLQQAIKLAGGPVAVGAVFEIRPQAVSQWTVCPAERVLRLCEETGWQVIPHQLRPDLYPNTTDGLPPEVAAREAA